MIFLLIFTRGFCTRAGPLLQAQEPSLQFCEGRSSTANSGTKAAVLPGTEKVNWIRQFPVAFCTPLSLQHLNRAQRTCAKRDEIENLVFSLGKGVKSIIFLSTTISHHQHHHPHHQHHHQTVPPKSRSFTANSGTKAAVLPKGKSCTTNSGTKVAVLLGTNRCRISRCCILKNSRST